MCDSSIRARRGAGRLAGMIVSLEFAGTTLKGGIALSIAEISLCPPHHGCNIVQFKKSAYSIIAVTFISPRSIM
jgi:hypothetical protein